MGETLLDIAKLVEGYGGEACKAVRGWAQTPAELVN